MVECVNVFLDASVLCPAVMVGPNQSGLTGVYAGPFSWRDTDEVAVEATAKEAYRIKVELEAVKVAAEDEVRAKVAGQCGVFQQAAMNAHRAKRRKAESLATA